MKAQLTVELTDWQLDAINDLVRKQAKPGEPVFLIAEPRRKQGKLKIAVWCGDNAAEAQEVLQGALAQLEKEQPPDDAVQLEVFATDNSGQNAA